MSDKKLELEAEIGRTFLQKEEAKQIQAKCAQKINELLVELKKVSSGNNKTSDS